MAVAVSGSKDLTQRSRCSLCCSLLCHYVALAFTVEYVLLAPESGAPHVMFLFRDRRAPRHGGSAQEAVDSKFLRSYIDICRSGTSLLLWSFTQRPR